MAWAALTGAPLGAERVPAGETPKVEAARSHASRPGAASGIDQRVALLGQRLGLTPSQRVRLRSVLLQQRDQLRRIWSDESLAAADRVLHTRALSRWTAERIRELLDDEQREKYGAPPQGDAGNAVGTARVEDWMDRRAAR